MPIFNEKTNLKAKWTYSKTDKVEGYEIGISEGNKNMTEQMIKYLFMDETELDKYSGSTSATCYKKRIMIALTNFWD